MYKSCGPCITFTFYIDILAPFECFYQISYPFHPYAFPLKRLNNENLRMDVIHAHSN